MSHRFVALLALTVASPALMGLKYVDIPHVTPAFVQTDRAPLTVAIVDVTMTDALQRTAADADEDWLNPTVAVMEALAYHAGRSNGQLAFVDPGTGVTPDALLTVHVESWTQSNPSRAGIAFSLVALDGSAIHEQKVRSTVHQGYRNNTVDGRTADAYARYIRTVPPLLAGVKPQNYAGSYEMEGRWYLMTDDHGGQERGPTDPTLCMQEAARDAIGTFLWPLTDHIVIEDMIMAGGKNWDAARSLLMEGNYDAAIASYQAVVDAKPGKHKSLFELAKALWAKGDMTAAVDTMKQTYDARSNGYYRNQLTYMSNEKAARRTVELPTDIADGTCFERGRAECCVTAPAMAAAEPAAKSASSMGASSMGATEGATGASLAVPAMATPTKSCQTFGQISCCMP